jgi:hypothetical protein
VYKEPKGALFYIKYIEVDHLSIIILLIIFISINFLFMFINSFFKKGKKITPIWIFILIVFIFSIIIILFIIKYFGIDLINFDLVEKKKPLSDLGNSIVSVLGLMISFFSIIISTITLYKVSDKKDALIKSENLKIFIKKKENFLRELDATKIKLSDFYKANDYQKEVDYEQFIQSIKGILLEIDQNIATFINHYNSILSKEFNKKVKDINKLINSIEKNIDSKNEKDLKNKIYYLQKDVSRLHILLQLEPKKSVNLELI